MRSPVSESETEYSCTSGCHTCGLGTSLSFKPAAIATPSPGGCLSNGTRKRAPFARHTKLLSSHFQSSSL